MVHTDPGIGHQLEKRSGNLRGRSVLFAVALLTIAGGGAWFRWGGSQTTAAMGRMDQPFSGFVSIPVEVDTVRRGTLVLEVSATGQTEPDRRATLASLVGGRVVAVTSREGDSVDVGQALVLLDPRDASLAVERAKAVRAEALTRYRERTLFDEEIADSLVRRERSAAVRASSGLDQAEVSLREAELALARTSVSAPFAGHVDQVHVAAGEHVGVGENLLDLVDLDPIRVEVQVVESELRWLQQGSSASIRLVAFPDTVFRARVASIRPSVDPETRTGLVTVVVPNAEGVILPGMFARITLDGRTFADRLLVPKDAVIERGGRSLVFVFEGLPGGTLGEGLAKWVYVTTALVNREYIEIVQGESDTQLKTGTLVLTGGHLTLIHDARVKIRSSTD
jgi:membrane fusion protein (multidrug efflux system)